MRVCSRADIEQMDFLSQMRPDQLGPLLQHSAVETVSKKQLLLREGEKPDALYYLIDGAVQLFTQAGPRERTLLVLKPGCFFITAAVVLDEILLTSARAVNNARVLRIDAKRVRAFIESTDSFARSIIFDLAKNYRHSTLELKDMRAKNALERLASWILTAQDEAGSAVFQIPYRKALLAAKLGMTPENLSREFARLAQIGVTVRGRTIQIENLDLLKQLT